MIETLTSWIKNEVEKAGKKGVVVGLSGGVDSSVAAVLAVKALGKANVLGVLLPEHAFSKLPDFTPERVMEQSYAYFLIQKFGLGYAEVSIKSPKDSLIYNLLNGIDMAESLDDRKIAIANIAPRLRMAALYFYASLNNFLVLGTTNKTEMKIGYFTKWGDGGVDLEPLVDLYKTEVFDLAKELEVPDIIINRAPTAGLWEGQTDEEELGMSYVELDNILKYLEYSSSTDYNYINNNEEKIKKVKDMISKNKHKTQSIPICKRTPILTN